MKFTPKTNEELSSIGLIKDGVYNFDVLEASDETSKSGNDMIKIKLGLWDERGVMRVIYDYLLEAMPHKLIHFCESTVGIDKYKSGELTAEDCVNKSGKVHITIEKGKEKPEGGLYPDRNSVKDYVKEDKTNDHLNDEIPF